MLKSVAMLVMLAATPALAQEGARGTDFATFKKLVVQVSDALATRPADTLALSLAQPNLSDEIAQALRAPHENRLKVAPR